MASTEIQTNNSGPSVPSTSIHQNNILDGGQSVEPLKARSKCAIVAFVIVGLAGGTIIGLSLYGTFGLMGSMGFIISTTSGGVVFLGSAAVIVYAVISHLKKKTAELPSENKVSVEKPSEKTHQPTEDNTDTGNISTANTSTSGQHPTQPQQKVLYTSLIRQAEETKKYLSSLDKESFIQAVMTNNLKSVGTYVKEYGIQILQVLDSEGMLPIHNAAEYGYEGLLKLFIDNNDDVNVGCQANRGKTPLYFAVFKQKEKAVKVLLDAPKINVNAKTNFNSTPLHAAVCNGNVNIVKMLLEKGAETDVQGNNNRTALHWAVENDHLEIVKELLPRANVNLKDKGGKTPLLVAAEKEYFEIGVCLINSKKANLDAQDSEGDTALHFAVRCNVYNNETLSFFNALINGKANLSVPNNDGKTPLTLAKEFSNLRRDNRIVSLLEKAGAV